LPLDSSTTQTSDDPALFERNLTDSQKRVIDALDQPRSVDDLAIHTGLSVPMLQSDLTMLKIRGLVTQTGGMVSRLRS
jgi:predicted Rossmann fold nucleotide-binding protein DprA/Smf involved in DNA uptake